MRGYCTDMSSSLSAFGRVFGNKLHVLCVRRRSEPFLTGCSRVS